jgi:hypothetical protein
MASECKALRASDSERILIIKRHGRPVHLGYI